MNLPNKITVARIVLIPIFMIIFLFDFAYHREIAAGIFLIAAATDGIDGYIARSRNLVTNLGKLLDPLADKLLVTAALLMLLQSGIVPAWAVFLILGRDLLINGMRSIAAAENIVIAARMTGKIKTCLQIAAIFLLLLGQVWTIYFFYFVVAFTVYSGIEYMYNMKGVFSNDCSGQKA